MLSEINSGGPEETIQRGDLEGSSGEQAEDPGGSPEGIGERERGGSEGSSWRRCEDDSGRGPEGRGDNAMR